MDFKVAGTQRGVTGIQLDLKNQGITEQIVRETLDQAHEARLEILRAMLRSIKRPREEISANAPRLIQIQINPEKIGLVIGPGGKTIRRLQEETGAKIDIEDSGIVTLSSLDAAGAEAARDKIQAMTEGVQLGRIYEGRVTSIKDFGAFVEILPGKDGLVHISELSDGYVSSVTDICRVGDPMLVKAIAVDDQDRVKLSRKAALAERGQPDELASRTRPAPCGGGGDPAAAAGRSAAHRRVGPRAGDRDRDRGGYGGDRDRGGPPAARRDPDRLRCPSGPAQLRRARTADVGRACSVRGPIDVRRPARSPWRTSCPTTVSESTIQARADSPKPADRCASRDRPADDRDRAGLSTPAGRADDEPEVTRRLRAQYAEIAQLAGGLAHEIRNPLSTAP